MTSRQGRELPTELVGITVDAPNAALAAARAEQLAAAPPATAAATGPFRVKCYVKSTKADLGYLGVSAANGVDLVGHDEAAICQWYMKDTHNYLQVNNATVFRYLGVGYHSYACWGLMTPTGWVNAVTPRNDSIYLSGDDNTLYAYGNGWVCWGNADTDIGVVYEPT